MNFALSTTKSASSLAAAFCGNTSTRAPGGKIREMRVLLHESAAAATSAAPNAIARPFTR